MKARNHFKLTALLLSITILISVIPVSTSATTDNAAESLSTATENKTAQLDKFEQDCQIHKYVDASVLSSKNHIARLHGEETLSSYVFANRDGTTTVYYMDEEVKFIDADGSIVEKDISLSAVSDGYTTTRNDIQLTLPTDPASGIRLDYNGKYISLTPQGGTLKRAAQVKENALSYPDYYGSGVSLVYTPTLSGVKEDIVLEQYTGVNSFTFRLNTNGLNIYQANGRYYLAESKLSASRFELGDVVAFDARGKFSVGKMSVTTIFPGQAYQITITTDEDFLTDENTVYPVSIDPTITVSDNTHGANAIEDTTIYSGVPTANGNWTYLHCGYYDSNYKVARTLVRLTSLLADSTYRSMSATQISSAYFHIREATGTAGKTINLYANSGSAAWTESGATWNNAGVSYNQQYASSTANSNSDTLYNITNLVKAWKNNTQVAEKGFVLVSTNEISVDKAFYSSEFSNTNFRPYVEVTYTPTTTQTVANGVYRIVSESAGLPIGTRNGFIANYTNVETVALSSHVGWQFFQYWKITHLGSDYYSIRPLYKQDMALDVTLENVDIYKVDKPDTLEDIPTYALWKIEKTANGTYVFKKNGLSTAALMAETSGTTAQINIKVGTYSATSSLCHFDLTHISPVPGALMLYTTANYLYMSSFATTVPTYITDLTGTKTMQELGFIMSVCDAYDPSQQVEWSSSNTSVATINYSTGAVTTLLPGETIITAARSINGTLHKIRFKLVIPRTSVNVQVVYDQEYLRKYPNSQSRISDYMDELKDFYLDNAAFTVNYSTPTVFQSLADQCPNTPNSTCNCGECYSTYWGIGELVVYDHHHTNINNILGHLPTNPNGKVIAFSGHDVCNKVTGVLYNTHVYNSSGNGLYGVAFDQTGSCVIATTTIPGITPARELQTVIHEFGHLFGAPDHYGGNTPNSNDLGDNFSRDCIYGENKESLTSPIICAGCKALIIDCINDLD